MKLPMLCKMCFLDLSRMKRTPNKVAKFIRVLKKGIISGDLEIGAIFLKYKDGQSGGVMINSKGKVHVDDNQIDWEAKDA